MATPVLHPELAGLLPLAKGGMAEVFLGLRRAPGGVHRLVVVKKIYPHLSGDKGVAKRFLNEARTMASLTHPNIVGVMDLIQGPDGFAMVLEYLSGENLHFVLERVRSGDAELPIPLACHLVSDVAHAVHFAHQADRQDGTGSLGFVHRDLSPSNMMVTYDGIVKVIDFGVSKTTMDSHYTDVGTVKGAQAYLSPEAVDGGVVDARSDVFSLGAVLFEMLTGQMAFGADNMAAQLELILRAEVPPPSEINPQVPDLIDQVVLDALKRDPRQRIRSAAVLRDRLTHALSRLGMRSGQRHVSAWMCTSFTDALAQRRDFEHRVIAEGHAEFDARSAFDHGTPFDQETNGVPVAASSEPWLTEIGRLWWLVALVLSVAILFAFLLGRLMAPESMAS